MQVERYTCRILKLCYKKKWGVLYTFSIFLEAYSFIREKTDRKDTWETFNKMPGQTQTGTVVVHGLHRQPLGHQGAQSVAKFCIRV